MTHFRACHAHIRLLIFCVVTQQTAKFWGVGTGDPGVGPMTPKFELERDFCTVHLTAKFHHVESFGSIVLTNTQTNTRLKTSTSLRYTTPVGNYIFVHPKSAARNQKNKSNEKN